eukprot:1391629-Amorphochlora_amoeboformis.AAC.2
MHQTKVITLWEGCTRVGNAGPEVGEIWGCGKSDCVASQRRVIWKLSVAQAVDILREPIFSQEVFLLHRSSILPSFIGRLGILILPKMVQGEPRA